MSVLRKTPCPTPKSCKRGYLVFHRKRLEPRVLPWQQYSRRHFVSFVVYISGARLEDHCINISGDILTSVFHRFSGTIYDVITSLICIIQKREYLLNEKKIFQNWKHHSSLLWKAFQMSSNYFLLRRHFEQESEAGQKSHQSFEKYMKSIEFIFNGAHKNIGEQHCALCCNAQWGGTECFASLHLCWT